MTNRSQKRLLEGKELHGYSDENPKPRISVPATKLGQADVVYAVCRKAS
jgi:hypothetical protein